MTNAILWGNSQIASGSPSRESLLCKRVVMLVAAVCGFSAVAAEFTIKAGSPDWSLPSSYNEGRAPSAGDTVIIPNNASVTVSDTSLASYETFAGLSLVKMGGKTASLEINVAEGAVRTNGCQISNGSTTFAFTGKVIKTGAGETVFTNWWNYSLVVDVHVKEGTFVPPQNYNKSGQSLHIGHVEVDEGATFVLANKSPDYTSSGECGTTYVQSFSGGGDIVLRGTSSMVCYVEGGTNTTFSGWIGPYVRLRPKDGSVLNLTGLANEFQAETGGDGTLTGPTFGMANSSSSSLGKGLLDFVGYGTFRYTGDGAETTDRTIQLRTTENGVDWIDAGTNGELTLTGKVQMQNSYKNMQRFGLSGDNEKQAVFAGSFVNSTQNATNYTYHVSKDGTGTWQMKANAASQWSGALSVLNGTLQFDSLADAGVQCALGSAEQLYDDYFGPVDPAHKVDWAWKLGAAETRGTLTYVGATGGWSTNRAAVVDVGGGKIANESSAELGVFGGIRPASTAATLTIGGSSTGYSVIGDVQGNLSLAKEDSGTWILDSGNTFSGKLEVKEGTLYVRDTTKYSWYKFVFKERQPKSGSEGETLYACEELGFYDQDNVRVNGGLRPYTNYSAVAENRLPPGFCGFQNPGSGPGYDFANKKTCPVEAMFDDGTPLLTVNATSTYLRRSDMSQKDCVVVDPGNPDTWSTVNMHFPFGSKVVSSFDLCQIAYGWNYQRAVKGFAIEGSVDGRRWDVLTNVTLTVATGNTTSLKWAFAKSDYSAGSAGTHTGGAPIAGRPVSSVKALSNVSAVSVAKGARLIGENADVEIRGLEVDGRGAGTIENCTFAQTGSIVVKNSKEATGDMLELGFVNCGSPERIANWTAVVDGKTRCKIDYRNGKLYVVRPGLLIVVQ